MARLGKEGVPRERPTIRTENQSTRNSCSVKSLKCRERQEILETLFILKSLLIRCYYSRWRRAVLKACYWFADMRADASRFPPQMAASFSLQTSTHERSFRGVLTNVWLSLIYHQSRRDCWAMQTERKEDRRKVGLILPPLPHCCYKQGTKVLWRGPALTWWW